TFLAKQAQVCTPDACFVLAETFTMDVGRTGRGCIVGLSVHQLHIFYTVAAKGSFSAAAQALHLSQPAVTMQIQALEEVFGTRLFHRSTKKVELTEAGRTLLPYAEQCLAL